jgi:gluconokinase
MILALDVGTSSARAGLYTTDAQLVRGRFHQESYAATTSADGGVELDPERVFGAVAACLDAVHAGRPRPDVLGVGVSTFWHGLLGFDPGGRPVTPVFTWADTRAAGEADVLRGALDERALHARTGCHLHTSYWPAKLRWLARAQPEAMRRVRRWGSFGEYLELALFGEAATSVSMASGTGLFDQEAVRWDGEALAAAGITDAQLFPLRDRTEARTGLREPWAGRWAALRRTPWFPAVGDGAAGNVGSGCVDPRRIALNVGTSAALRVLGTPVTAPPAGLWRYRLDRRLAVIGGATSEGGNVYSWLRGVLKLPGAADVEAAIASAPPDAHGLTMLPFLAGERSPGWRGGRRAVIAGLSLDTTPLEILRAGLEAVALRLAVVHALLAPLAAPDARIVASGGGVASSPAWGQIIADAIGCAITESREEEATSRGTALLALHALRIVGDLAAVPAPLGRTFVPDPARHARYRSALERQRRLEAIA